MDISLIETLRFEPGQGFIRLERHLARLSASAQALGLPGADKAREALRAPADTRLSRVRLELFADGRIEVRMTAFQPLAPETIWRLKVARTRLDSADPLLRHKTSHRAAYTAARAEFPATEADEVLLLNERGEICEGAITSVFLDDGSGVLKTPPLASGLLAGVLRAELLESGGATEQVLRPEDLSGHAILVGNSLRGLIRGRLS